MLALSEKNIYLCGNTLKLIDCIPYVAGYSSLLQVMRHSTAALRLIISI